MIRDYFLHNPSFIFKNNIFYQKDFNVSRAFEDTYLELRDKENRMYADEVIRNLPEFSRNHRFTKEWDMRKDSLSRFVNYLKKDSSYKSILELGCGNGWLSSNLANALQAEVCATDINEPELSQGANIFSYQPNLFFVHADIFGSAFRKQSFNVIILAGAIQYFPDLDAIISQLLDLLTPSGEIHIFDSPFYHQSSEVEKARLRSAAHFNTLGLPLMREHYHYHLWTHLKNFNYEILHDPGSLINRIKEKYFHRHHFHG